MSKVYVLSEDARDNFKLVLHINRIVGVVSNEDVAARFGRLRACNNYRSIELDDPELLNRIAKESESK